MAYEKFDKLVADRTKQWTDELSDFCRIPCETAQLSELKRGAKWTADRLRKAGAKIELIEKDGVAPLVVGEMGSGKRTLICVQHYDVQPAAPLDLWTSPPYEPLAHAVSIPASSTEGSITFFSRRTRRSVNRIRTRAGRSISS